MKEKQLKMISRCSKAINTIHVGLKTQEAKNKEYRTQISEGWSDRTRDKELEALHKQLAEGRKVVRAYQTALHELKVSRRSYNTIYDGICYAESQVALSMANTVAN